MRDIILDAVTGALLGVVFIVGLFALDIAQIGTMTWASASPTTVIAMLAIGIIPFFSACAVSIGVMMLPWEADNGGDR